MIACDHAWQLTCVECGYTEGFEAEQLNAELAELRKRVAELEGPYARVMEHLRILAPETWPVGTIDGAVEIVGKQLADLRAKLVEAEKHRDAALADRIPFAEAYNKATLDRATKAEAERDAALRQVDRLQRDNTIEGDFITKREIEQQYALAAARAEVERLKAIAFANARGSGLDEVIDALKDELAEARANAIEECAKIAEEACLVRRQHGDGSVTADRQGAHNGNCARVADQIRALASSPGEEKTREEALAWVKEGPDFPGGLVATTGAPATTEPEKCGSCGGEGFLAGYCTVNKPCEQQPDCTTCSGTGTASIGKGGGK